jgi:hypothetical protein
VLHGQIDEIVHTIPLRIFHDLENLESYYADLLAHEARESVQIEMAKIAGKTELEQQFDQLFEQLKAVDHTYGANLDTFALRKLGYKFILIGKRLYRLDKDVPETKLKWALRQFPANLAVHSMRRDFANDLELQKIAANWPIQICKQNLDEK